MIPVPDFLADEVGVSLVDFPPRPGPAAQMQPELLKVKKEPVSGPMLGDCSNIVLYYNILYM